MADGKCSLLSFGWYTLCSLKLELYGNKYAVIKQQTVQNDFTNISLKHALNYIAETNKQTKKALLSVPFCL